jgi:hypothetical protein
MVQLTTDRIYVTYICPSEVVGWLNPCTAPNLKIEFILVVFDYLFTKCAATLGIWRTLFLI